MKNKTINTEQGHWILAKMGKKILRPGGRELTLKLIENLKITAKDAVVEFAPGMGYTASFLLKNQPKSYTGIELNEEAAERLSRKMKGSNCNVLNRSAADTSLNESSVEKVIGEAMLTMQVDYRKSEIIGEAFRILKKGGLYGIHELGLVPDGLDPAVKDGIQLELAKAIKVNARPLSQAEWCQLLESEGFKIKEIHIAPMHLLEPKRIINDEGIFRTMKIMFNILTHPEAKDRIRNMRHIFQKYEKQMAAFAIIAEK